jgi:apolipoprotein D and lipocalin family protein
MKIKDNSHDKRLWNSVTKIFALLNSKKKTTIPEGVKAVTSFEKEKYLGLWFEIARLDFFFERNLNNTTAEYSLKNDGSIKVINRGFNYKTQKWKQAIGKARFIGDPSIAMLEVSFFGPFYSGYNVIALDIDYTYALVSGRNKNLLWILSRTATIPTEIKENYTILAQKLGYNTDQLVWVEQKS